MAATGEVVLITGGASGIGRRLATHFAADGAHVVLWDVNRDALDDAVAELRAEGWQATAHAVNLADRDAVRMASKRVFQDAGEVDILINNAGVVSGKPLVRLEDAEIERTFAVNTLALFWVTRAFLPRMLERGSGRVVTVASAGGLVGTPKMTDYCASKFAAVGFDESLRAELKQAGGQVKTTVVCPYYIDTGMFAGVRTRFPLLLPILKPAAAAARIHRGIRRGRARIIMPPFVYTVFLARLLPVAAFDAILDFCGITHSMDRFRGRDSS